MLGKSSCFGAGLLGLNYFAYLLSLLNYKKKIIVIIL